MKTNLIGLSKPILKIFSLIFGYFFWLIIAQNQNVQIKKPINLYFFGLNKNLGIVAPIKKVNTIISGKRINLGNFKKIENSAHIDLSDYNNSGTYTIALEKENIFLHNEYKLINYWPSSLSIQLDQKKF